MTNEEARNEEPVQPAAETPEATPPTPETTSNEGSSETEQAPALTGPVSEDRVREELKKVIDPELFVNIVDLGLIYEVSLSDSEEEPEKKNVHINMTMTSPMCPAGPQLIGNSKQVVGALEDVSNVEVKIVLDPPWTPDKMTEDARDQLGIF